MRLKRLDELHVIIVSLPGTWQRILRKKIESFSHVKVINVVSGSLSASKLIKEQTPDIILIDSSIPFDDMSALVREIKIEHPNTQSIVITDTTVQQREIARSGADFTLSSFHLESQINEVFSQLIELLRKDSENSNSLREGDREIE